jgi:hypothetical protein
MHDLFRRPHRRAKSLQYNDVPFPECELIARHFRVVPRSDGLTDGWESYYMQNMCADEQEEEDDEADASFHWVKVPC